jgi:glycosyltransferase involved in cell wall biosynthesis
MNKPELSVIIPYHNEGLDFISTTVKSIQDTIDVSYEIIVVDDCSDQPLGSISGRWEDLPGVKILRHNQPKGVGQAFDTGVKQAKADNLFLMGSDIRFIPNNWASKMIKEADDHPKAFTCTTCVGLNAESEEGMDINIRKNRSRRNGARILIFHDKKSHPKKPDNFRNILECQWLPVYKGESKESFEIPAILGAAYIVKKEWYNYVDGWWGHRSWGTLEPMISLKSWFMGGSCRTAPDVMTGHIFKRHGTHGTLSHHLMYNKLLVATLLFDEHNSSRLIAFLGHNPQVDKGRRMFKKYEKQILAKRKEYEKKIVVDPVEWCETWNHDFRL